MKSFVNGSNATPSAAIAAAQSTEAANQTAVVNNPIACQAATTAAYATSRYVNYVLETRQSKEVRFSPAEVAKHYMAATIAEVVPPTADIDNILSAAATQVRKAAKPAATPTKRTNKKRLTIQQMQAALKRKATINQKLETQKKSLIEALKDYKRYAWQIKVGYSDPSILASSLIKETTAQVKKQLFALLNYAWSVVQTIICFSLSLNSSSSAIIRD